MEHGIGRTTHGDIERHRVHKGLAGSDIARQNALVAIFVVSQSILHHLSSCCLEEFYAIGVSSQNGTVTRQ